jgi:hypothetical protein
VCLERLARAKCHSRLSAVDPNCGGGDDEYEHNDSYPQTNLAAISLRRCRRDIRRATATKAQTGIAAESPITDVRYPPHAPRE